MVTLRKQLGQVRFEAAWAAGRSLPLSEAVREALSEESPAAVRTTPVQVVDPLTRREREVAVLLAQGRTNRQIAEQLVISNKTTSVHVEHILGKLDLHSRWQVADWLAAHGSAGGGDGTISLNP